MGCWQTEEGQNSNSEIPQKTEENLRNSLLVNTFTTDL